MSLKRLPFFWRSLSFAICLPLLVASHAFAVPVEVAVYPFTGNSRASTDTDSNSTASNFLDGPAFTGSFAGTGNPAPSIEVDGAETPNDSTPESGGFYEWTVTPTTGNAAIFQQLTFNAQSVSTTTSSGHFSNFRLYWSGDGYSSPLGTHSESTSANSSSDFSDLHTFNFGPLSAKGGTTTFRMVVSDGSTQTQKRNRLDNIKLSADFIAAGSTTSLSPMSKDSIIGEADVNGPTPAYVVDGNNPIVGVGGNTSGNAGYNRNVVLGFELPTLDGPVLSASLTLTKNDQNNPIVVDLYGLGTSNPDGSGTSLFLEADSDPNAANTKLVDNFFFSGDAVGKTRTADVTDFILALYAGNSPLQSEAFFRLNPDTNLSLNSVSRTNFNLNGAVLSITTAAVVVPEPMSICMAGIGALGVLLLVRRRRLR